jgi:hypothetical protein
MYEVGELYLMGTKVDCSYEMSLIVITNIRDNIVTYKYIAKKDNIQMKSINNFGSYVIMKVGVTYE